jgi:outer membrane protein OmpA-like peptidoglycan-associated protein/uncharacterized protein YidB (DUF937 family)
MGALDGILNETTSELGIDSSKATTLVSGLLEFINQEGGGLRGFVDRFRGIGLGDLISGWQSGGGRALNSDQVQTALGRDTLSNLASRSGLSLGTAGAALAFIIPKLIRRLAPTGVIPTSLPPDILSSYVTAPTAAVASGVRQASAAPVPAVSRVVVEQRRGSPSWAWLLPLIALLIGFIAWRSVSAHRPRLASITLPCGTLSVEQGSFNYNLANFMLTGADSDVPKKFVVDNLNFDSSTARLTPASNRTLANLDRIMKCYPNMTVQLQGHTDATGDAESNKKLSLDRANAVKDLLVQGGIDPGRIATSGLGDEQPIASNDTDQGRAKNRRTELVVTRIK